MLSEEEILERLANFMVVELPLYDSEVDSEYAKKVISASIFLDIVSGLRFHATKQNAAQKLKNIYNAISAYEKMIALRQEIVNGENPVLSVSTPQIIIDSTFREDIKK